MMRSIPDPGFAGDDGGVDPGVSAALAAYDEAPEADEAGRRNATLAALQGARVLVPVVAVLGEVAYDGQGLSYEKSSEMAAVLITGEDGRTALLAFTGSASLHRWAQARPGRSCEGGEPRPVPVTIRQAAQAALHDGAQALLLDVAGPVLFVVEGEGLCSLADGCRLVPLPGGRWGWVSPAG